ncbi:MAG: sulfite reductase subunit beta [Candidatus Melainabacteria bacterium RIFCSPHIGHO2_02_FULL_34_12]|nr:MAG: sulfite reductase subunit beta [Candidatus Melainabacteria bacterium RIFCSPHIGHO2_02_FULL_34_12]
MSNAKEKEEEKKTKEEIVKENSNYLRGTIKEELSQDTAHFSSDSGKLLKFHGVYEQDDRDTRQERVAKKLEKEYIFMIRTKLPGGQLTADQYLKLNLICDRYSNKTLRITTRQTIQFHGIIKGNLRKTLNEINKNLITTYGGCGDVVRNVMACPVCDIDPEYSINLNNIAKEISNHLLPNTKAYYEIWIDDEKVPAVGRDGKSAKEEEPLYGKTYLPRKFKIGLALPQDNCIDLFTQDIGVVAIIESVKGRVGEGAKLQGFNLLIGGGLGHHHNKPETYPRLATELCFVTPDKLIDTLEKIVTIQRDYGSRGNRKHARMKYLIDDRGLDWFKAELEKRVGVCLDKPMPVASYRTCDHLGWNKQNNGNRKWYLGLFIENGRICDQDGRKIKSGLKEIIEKFQPDIRLTPQQNIILTNINEEDKEEINQLVQKHKIFTKEIVSKIRRNSMACVALPTCGLALAEAERALPGVMDELEEMGFGDEEISIRMSGCPNSCSRPPVAELGIIGMSTDKYNIYIGGDFNGTRLNKTYKESVAGKNLAGEIAQLIREYHSKCKSGERFGDFYNRIRLKDFNELV